MSFKLRIAPVKPAETGEVYDVVIVGGGPAGLTAALYSARYELKPIVITKLVGGYMTEAPLVDDYPGLPDTPGEELVNRFVSHVRKYNVPIIQDEVVDVKRSDKLWCVQTASEKTYCGYAVIIAVGSEKRKLGVKGEDEFVGRGVSYCATCDGPLFKGKVVAVVGGGNSALTSALYLANLASKVYLIHRRSEFKAFKIYVERAEKNPKIEILRNSIVKEIIGDTHVRAIVVYNNTTNEEKTLNVDGVFIEIGLKPPREFFEKIGVKVDESGHAVVNVDRSTNLEGVFVAGDAAGGPYKYRFEQIITAAAEGAIAADAAFKYILSVKK
ncbi:thioredoxin-disulfide reductase [Thermogladius sp. 4427co]|uniref:thioredoxin-disulfide reductase n=1 Tax=Thermogladius sp. 4427co TaxID=3450718 RepID=UPI003F7A01F6